MKKLAVIQSSYIPWKGYFDIISLVDEFILYDDVQYTRRDWRNRNLIKTPDGSKWITIPVDVKDKYHQKIKDTKISDPKWGGKHWKSIVHNYSRAAHFSDYKDLFEEMYLGTTEEHLSEVNYKFIKAVCGILGIDTRITWSMEYTLEGNKTERLANLCKATGCCEYISGPTAKSYTDESVFEREDIKLTWMDYSGYTEYNQLYPPFVHTVSIIDLIFNEGPDAGRFMKSF